MISVKWGFLTPLRNFDGTLSAVGLFHSFDEKVRRALERRSNVCVSGQMTVAPSIAVLPAVQAERSKILLVEDEVLIRMMLVDDLRGRGFNVVEAQNADEALTLLQSRVPFGLVLTDVQLPGSMDGIGLARLLRATRPETKVVIASGNISRAPSGDVAHAFVRKPYAPDQIVKCIETLLASP